MDKIELYEKDNQWHIHIDADEKKTLNGIVQLINEASLASGQSFSEYLEKIRKEKQRLDELNRQEEKLDKELETAVRRVLDTMPSDEAAIFKAYAGLDQEPMTTAEIAQRYDRKISQINHVIDKVIQKIKADPEVSLKAILLNEYKGGTGHGNGN